MEKTPTLFGEALGGLKPEAPVSNGRLTLLPFTCTRPGKTRYVLLAKAIKRGRLTVTEVSDGGAVPYLKAVNQGPWPVLIFDGEELIGAKQNRIVNTTILVGVGETILPVSCVEQGRWSHRSRAFASGEWTSHPRLRREKEAQVRNFLALAPEATPGMARPQQERASDFRADQGAVWQEVERQSRDLGVGSETSAMADAYADRAPDIEEALLAFGGQGSDAGPGTPPVEGMVGAAVFLDGAFLCLDTLWSVRRYGQIYPKLLRGYALEALQAPPAKRSKSTDPEAEVLRLFAELGAATPDERAGVDLGTDLRVETKTAFGAGLAFEGDMLQLSVFPR
ncbi:MAG: ARPP-1 family domain-containing protein [Thermoleophilia bacterium]